MIERAIFQLLEKEPFYAYFISECAIEWDTRNVPTAGAAVIGGTPTLIFNREWMAGKTLVEWQAVLKHEVAHLLFMHLTRCSDEKLNPALYNIAADCTINQYIDGLPAGGITLEVVSKLCKEQLLPFQTTGYYYDKLLEKAPKANLKPMDTHGIDGEDKGVMAEAAVKVAATSALKSAVGNVSQAMLEALNLNGKAQLPWQALLRNFVMSAVSRHTKLTSKKLNRRLPLPAKGRKHKRTLTLGVCFDESGSVSNDQLQLFFQELKTIARTVGTTWLVHADYEVKDVEKLTDRTKVKAQRKAGGGTAYQPAIDKCMQLGCNAIVYFGDFDCADQPKAPPVPFLWVGVGSSPPPGDFGRVVRLNEAR